MIKEIFIGIVDVVRTLSSKKKKYGDSTKSELQIYGSELADQLAELNLGNKRDTVQLFTVVHSELLAKSVPRFGEIVVGAAMYNRLRKIGYTHSRAQAAVGMWDHHTQGG